MSDATDAFIAKLLAHGFKLESAHDGAPFLALSKGNIKIFQDSEHYFTLGIQLENGNWISFSAPINKIILGDSRWLC